MEFQLPFNTVVVICCVIGLYMVFILCMGLYFSRFSSNINDFFFSGQRFSWWLPAFSMMATGIGSYSYLKYSQQGYDTGMSSTMGYMNEWFVLPVFIFAWLPILYYGRIKSVPEYFEKRFNRAARYMAVVLILSYIFYYMGYNLYTMGLVMKGVFGLSPLYTVPFITVILGFYVTFGGQTAVILTDLFQGLMLYLAGFLVVGFGLYALGGLGEFWSYLPPAHRMPFASFRGDPHFNSLGVFWGDALAGSAAFLFIHQGVLMRFLSVRNLKQARKTALFNMLVCLPLSAVTVGAAGWITKAVVTKQNKLGTLPGYDTLSVTDSYNVFIDLAFMVLKHHEWLLGVVVAALVAALMSTVDTLVNASSAIGVYDIYKPLMKPRQSERHYLKVARMTSVLVIGMSLLLVVWFFNQRGTLMSIHYKGIMTIIPPVVTTIFLGVFWPRFDSGSAALALLIGGGMNFLTVALPAPVIYLRHFFMGPEAGEPVFFRAIFGVILTAAVGIVSCLLRKEAANSGGEGLTVQSLDKAVFKFKGGKPNYDLSSPVKNLTLKVSSGLKGKELVLSSAVAKELKAKVGDLIYVSDQRWFLGGLRSGHFQLKELHHEGEAQVYISEEGLKGSYMLLHKKAFVEKTI